MAALEPFCLGIVALYVALRLRQALRGEAAGERRAGDAGAGDARAVLTRLVLLSLAAWIGEATCVRVYGFYRYALPDEGGPWRLWIDVVPLVVVLTWPVVIHSAWELARSLAPRTSVALTAAIVLADASLIEPISVATGLWSWTRPGPFAVPLVGVLGWGMFTVIAAFALDGFERARQEGRATWPASLLLLSAGATVHLPLLATWWGGLRFVPAPSEGVALGLAALASLSAAIALWRGPRADSRALWLRAPGASFFFVLLALGVREPMLWAWTLVLALPYPVLAARATTKPAPVPEPGERDAAAL